MSQSRVNRRESFRCPVAGQQKAELVVGESRVPVVVEDESATGFGVTTEQPLQLQPGEVVQLHTDAGCSEVRVARIVVVEAAATEMSQESAGGPTFRLGLQRIRDLPHLSSERLPCARWRDILFPPWVSLTHVPMVVTGILLAALVIGVPVVTMLWFQRSDRPFSQQVAGWLHRSGAEEARGLPASPGPESRMPLASRRSAAGPTASPPLLVPESLHSTLDRLLANPAVTAPNAIRKLDLTPGQQRQLSRLLEQTAEAFQTLGSQRARLTEEEQAQIRQKLLEAARRQALDLLTTEQRKLWDDLSPSPRTGQELAPPPSPRGKPDGSTL